jgi:hypothetical protein
MKIGIGTTFRSNYADSNPLWKVTKKLGPKVWEAVIQSEPIVIDGKTYEGDYAGTVKAFLEDDIARTLQFAKACGKMGDDSDRWYAGLRFGSVVHYKHGRSEFVRCEVVLSTEGKKELLPFALVGEWRKWDLPQRYEDGTIYLGYHAQQIIEKKRMHPHASNILEYNADKRDVDPTKLKEISLEVPLMTFEQERTAACWKKVFELREALQRQEQESPEDILKRFGTLLGNNLIVDFLAKFGKQKATI